MKRTVRRQSVCGSVGSESVELAVKLDRDLKMIKQSKNLHPNLSRQHMIGSQDSLAQLLVTHNGS